jgi:hypothetical protein
LLAILRGQTERHGQRKTGRGRGPHLPVSEVGIELHLDPVVGGGLKHLNFNSSIIVAKRVYSEPMLATILEQLQLNIFRKILRVGYAEQDSK